MSTAANTDENATLRITRDGAVVRIALARAESGNRMPQAAVAQLAAELHVIAADDAVKLVVLSGDGDHFCQGREQGQVTKTDKPTPLELRKSMMDPIVSVYSAFRAVQVPIISLVQGEAHGFGAALAASADITIAADNACFSFPELKSDMPPTLAMATVMDRVSHKALAWMVYTNEVIDAQAAMQIGLVSKVVPASELTATGEALVAKLLERTHGALSGVKQYLARARLQSFDDAADTGRNLLAIVLSSK
jgi:enoyl-CoA hydratase/carnithine racemase